MQIDIAESMRETLAELNSVGLYGIGTLSLNHNPASFGEQRKSLLPPSMQLHFNESNSSNTSLFKWLQEKYDISSADAEKAFKIFCEKLLNGLVNYGKVNIRGLASFYQKEDNTLECIPDKDFVDLFYNGLPEIPVSHIDKRDLIGIVGTGIEDQVLDEESLNLDRVLIPEKTTEISDLHSFNKADTQEKVVSKIETLEVNAEFEESFELLRKDFIEEPIAPKVVPMTQDNTIVSIKKENPVQKLENPVKKKENPIQKPFDSNATWDPKPLDTGYKADSIFNGRNIALLIGLLLLLLIGYFGCQKVLNSSNSGNTAGSDSTEIEQNAIAIADSIANDEIAKEEFTFKGVPIPEKCVIVTGSFKKSRNAIRMQDRLLKEGYDVFQSVEGGLTRVGFKFDCREVNLEDYLNNIRRTISQKAWYLDPSLYVEYEL